MKWWDMPPIDSEEVLQHAMAEQARLIKAGEDRIRDIVREEISKAFASVSESVCDELREQPHADLVTMHVLYQLAKRAPKELDVRP